VLVVMKRGASQREIDAVVARIQEFGITPISLPGQERMAIGTFGTTSRAAAEAVESLPGVAEVVPVSRPFKLASREVIPDDTVVRIGTVPVGAGAPLAIMAGPCSVESREQTLETARAVRAAGATILRGGAFKPRSSPYNFRGLGVAGLDILEEARAETGLAVVTEVLTPGDVEYVLARGNRNVILCERGIRTFEKYTRNTFDVNAIPLLKRLTHLPVIGDPSHGTGKWYLVAPVALAAVAAGADGLMIEVHPSPDHALSDGFQSLTFDNFAALVGRASAVAHAVGRAVPDAARA